MMSGVASDAVNFGGVLGPAPRTLSSFSNHIFHSLDEHRLDIGVRYDVVELGPACSILSDDDVDVIVTASPKNRKRHRGVNGLRGSLS